MPCVFSEPVAPLFPILEQHPNNVRLRARRHILDLAPAAQWEAHVVVQNSWDGASDPSDHPRRRPGLSEPVRLLQIRV